MSVRTNLVEPAGPYAKAFFEWLLAVAPVAAYVTAEHLFVPSKSAHGFFSSAEWGIVSSFLCIIAIYLVLLELPRISSANRPVKLGPCILTAFALFMTLLGSIFVSVAILSASDPNGTHKAHLDIGILYFLHWTIFVSSSLVFLFLKGMCESIKVKNRHHD